MVVTWVGPVIVCEVGLVPTLIVTVLKLDGQLPLAIVHCNTLAPELNPLTEVVAEEELLKVAVPLSTVQVPVPVAGTLAERLVEALVMYWALPALEAVGGADTVTAMAALGLSQALVV